MKPAGVAVLAAASALALTAASLGAVALLAPGLPAGGRAACPAPSLPGTVVGVTATDLGMMMAGPGMMPSGMRLAPDRATVPHGRVAFSLTNMGHLPHELLILPLPDGHGQGQRVPGPDGRVEEAGLLGEASASCAEGAGPGVLPGTRSWTTVDLPPGRYEVLCNFPGHYAAGMHAAITAT